MRFKKEIVFAKSKFGMVYIIPTDDLRIKFVITPYAADGGDLISQVQNNIATMSEQEATSQMELLLPTFKVKYESDDTTCVGKQIEEDNGTEEVSPSKWIKSGTFATDIELSSMKVNEAAISSQISKNTEIVNSDFLFALIDGEIEDKLQM